MKRKVTLLYFYLFILFLDFQTPVSAGIGKKLGVYSLDWLYIGSSYVILRRISVYSKKYLSDEKSGELKLKIKEIYQKTRSPTLLLHNFVMILATIFGVLHGLLTGRHFKPVGIVGWLAVVFMILLSVSGYIIWQKFQPLWSNRRTRSQIRWMHKQWMFSAALIIFLFLHLEVFG